MKTKDDVANHFEFCFPRMDTLLLVEVAESGVTIRATRDTFSPQRKASFVRELVAEGFIPEEFRWLPVGGAQSYGRGIRWLVDFSWLQIEEAVLARMHRMITKLFAFAFVFTVLLVGLVATGRIGNHVSVPPAGVPYSDR
jgi:hypothetical protein